MAEKDDEKSGKQREGSEKASALEAYKPGPPVSEPDDVGEVDAVESERGPLPAPAEGSAEVRAFAVENALHWLRHYRFDGLRLDAVHAIATPGEPTILAEISERVGRLAQAELGGPYVRHPSHGGASEFRVSLIQLLRV